MWGFAGAHPCERFRRFCGMCSHVPSCNLQIPEDRDNINGLQQLSLEATAVNQSLSQQLLVKVRVCVRGARGMDCGRDMSMGCKHEVGWH